MFICRDCDFEFEKPGTTTATDGIRGWSGPYFVECCPRCGSESYFEVFHVGECVKGEC